MCEELTLLPCPACKNTNVVLRAYTRAYGFCTACGMCGPCAPKVNAEYAIRQWNELPRQPIPRPFEEWHEDYGDVLWWRFPLEGPPISVHPSTKIGSMTGTSRTGRPFPHL